jgi:cell division protein FtsW
MSTFARTDTSLLARWWWTVDHWTLGALLLLIGLGLVLTMAASTAVATGKGLDAFYFAQRQFIYLPAALCVLLATSLLSPTGVRRIAAVVFVIGFALTAMTLFTGAEVKGATRWVRFGGVSLQPSEMLKVGYAVVSAWIVAESRAQDRSWGYYASAATMLAVAGVLVLQPDIGTTVLIAAVWSIQVFLAGLPLALVFVVVLLFAGGAAAAYFSFDHVRYRVDHFFDPTTGDGFQISRALDAFKSGGLFGRGPGEGQVKDYLPDAHADFIFAVAGEEFGLAFCLLLLAIFAFVVIRGFSRALKAEDIFVVLASAGLLALFGMQALMNIASSTHLIPPKGITLPFISYGGSSTLAMAWAMGMVLALTRERREGRS